MSTVASGEIDYEELEEQLAANVNRPAIINVNIGTTVILPSSLPTSHPAPIPRNPTSLYPPDLRQCGTIYLTEP